MYVRGSHLKLIPNVCLYVYAFTFHSRDMSELGLEFRSSVHQQVIHGDLVFPEGVASPQDGQVNLYPRQAPRPQTRVPRTAVEPAGATKGNTDPRKGETAKGETGCPIVGVPEGLGAVTS